MLDAYKSTMESLYDGVCASGPCSTYSDDHDVDGLYREWGPASGSNMTYWIFAASVVTSLLVFSEALDAYDTMKPLVVVATCDVESAPATRDTAQPRRSIERFIRNEHTLIRHFYLFICTLTCHISSSSTVPWVSIVTIMAFVRQYSSWYHVGYNDYMNITVTNSSYAYERYYLHCVCMF